MDLRASGRARCGRRHAERRRARRAPPPGGRMARGDRGVAGRAGRAPAGAPARARRRARGDAAGGRRGRGRVGRARGPRGRPGGRDAGPRPPGVGLRRAPSGGRSREQHLHPAGPRRPLRRGRRARARDARRRRRGRASHGLALRRVRDRAPVGVLAPELRLGRRRSGPARRPVSRAPATPASARPSPRSAPCWPNCSSSRTASTRRLRSSTRSRPGSTAPSPGRSQWPPAASCARARGGRRTQSRSCATAWHCSRRAAGRRRWSPTRGCGWPARSSPPAGQARTIASSAAARAMDAGLQGALGAALRAEGRATAGDAGIELLERAATMLATTPLRLEHGWAEHDLGAALRRAGAGPPRASRSSGRSTPPPAASRHCWRVRPATSSRPPAGARIAACSAARGR